MDFNCNEKRYFKVSIPMDEASRKKIQEIVHREGYSIGRWIRRLILDEIARREAIERGATQVDFDYLRRRSSSDNSRAVTGAEIL